MENVLIQKKIKALFDKVVDPDYVLNSYYTDGLINKLSQCKNGKEFTFLEKTPIVSDLIANALDHVDSIHISAKVFLIRMLGVVSHSELHFSKVFTIKGDKICDEMKTINALSTSSSLRVAYMEVVLAIVEHNSGIAWLLKTGVWKEICNLCNEKRTVFVVRQVYQFAAKFFWRLNDLCDEVNIKQALGFILKPVSNLEYFHRDNINSEEEKVLCKTLEPMTQILYSIVSEDGRIYQPTMLIELIIKEYHIMSHLCFILERTRNDELALIVSKLFIYFSTANIFLTKPLSEGTLYTRDDFLEVGVNFINTVQRFIQRRSPFLVIDFCTSANLMWMTIWKDKNAMWVNYSSKMHLPNQMLFICLVPLLIYITYKQYTSDDCLDRYFGKVFELTCEHTIKTGYAMRDIMEEMDSFSITLHSVKKLTSLKNYLNDEQANIVFQSLFYILKEYDPTDKCNGAVKADVTLEDSQEKVLVLTYVMDTVLCLVKYRNINWKTSLEVICLYNVVYNILRRPNLTCKFVVTALNVIQQTVEKFLTPNLSLLVESKPGSNMHELGKLIYMKMNDFHWEVRDSALELLLVCTELSEIKFPPFQKQILESKLINLATTIAFNDNEYYVQASALKCLGAATKITTMWEEIYILYPDIEERLLEILQDNQEGLVRKEACNVLCEMYKNVQVSSTFKETLYEHMVSSALSDFHWEVQLAALKFWHLVMKTLFTCQGMLDGTFPRVTFSKETRKIVNLNEAEIQSRLIKILDKLASVGCLTVFVKMLNDDTEVVIMDSALTVATELYEILNKYKLPDMLKPIPGEPTTVEDLINDVKDENDDSDEIMMDELDTVSADNVIEDILKSDDINLLSSIYKHQMRLNIKPHIQKPKIKLMQMASPYMFVNFMKNNDLKAIIDSKRQWRDGIRSISSLLDDVLGIYEHNDVVNSLDCY